MSQIISLGLSPIVILFVNSSNATSERRFDRGYTIATLKERLEPIVGVSAATMTLKLLSSTDELIAVLNDDEKMLGYYPVEDYMRLVVTDRNPHKGSDFSDVSKVQKLELDDKEYDKMRGTVREFKRMNKVGRFAEPKADDAAAAELASNEFQQEASTISVGDRFQVKLADGSSLQKRGVVMFVGKTDFKPGFWVGVEYDEPVGKHDGSMHGVSYFTAKPGHGVFLRPDKIEVGDFPEEDLFADDDEF